MTRQRLILVAMCVALAAGLAYLRDPPWAERVTSGLGQWEEDPPGTRFRWTVGRASFFVPNDATTLTLPMRAVFPGPGGQPTMVRVSVDDRFLADIALPDPAAWVRASLPLPRKPTSRRARRVDLHVNRTAVGVAILGVMTGEMEIVR